MGSWAFNPSGCFEYWSRELFQIYGLDPQKGAPTLEEYLATVHPADRDFMAETIKGMCEQGCGCDVKKRIIRPDGAVRYIRCVGIPVLDQGVLKGFLGTAMDVTEQEQLTQELKRREEYLSKAQILSHTGSFGWKPDTGEIVLVGRKLPHLRIQSGGEVNARQDHGTGSSRRSAFDACGSGTGIEQRRRCRFQASSALP